jgi:transcriptional regulator with XRE-family HTH domain
MTLKESLDLKRGVDLAREIGVHAVTISAWRRGASFPPSTRLPSLASALGIPLTELQTIVDKARRRSVILAQRSRKRQAARDAAEMSEADGSLACTKPTVAGGA